MRRVTKPRCRYGCVFLQISDNLWLCEHIAWGSAVSLKGAVEEARRLVERAGGYRKLLGPTEPPSATRAKKRARPAA